MGEHETTVGAYEKPRKGQKLSWKYMGASGRKYLARDGRGSTWRTSRESSRPKVMGACEGPRESKAKAKESMVS